MIRITNTPSLTGVTISGDFYDLFNLVEAFHEITIDEFTEKHRSYIEISTRVPGFVMTSDMPIRETGRLSWVIIT